MVYPTILAGQKLTASLLSSMQPLWAGKTASTSRSSTTTATADPELALTVEANAEYAFSAFIRYSGGQTGDLKCTFTGPSGSSGSWGARTMSTTATAATDSSEAIRTPNGTTKAIGNISTSVPQTFNVMGRLITSSTSGTFSFDWAQNTSDATATVIEADSYMTLIRVL